MDYATLSDLKSEMGITDTEDDASLGRCITDASRLVDLMTHVVTDAYAKTTDTRYYDVDPVAMRLEVDRKPELWIDPLQSITTLKADSDGDRTFDETWASTDYLLYPRGGPPYYQIVADGLNGDYAGFPSGRKRVEITGLWGNVDRATESVVRRGTLLLARRLWYRRNSPEGVIGDAERGFVTLQSMDPDVAVVAARLRDEWSYFA